jgi:carbamoyltransferase
MITWGISANSHNAAVAVFDNDDLIFASACERWSGVKNDPMLSSKLINYLYDRNLIPNHVVWYEKPLLKSFRQFKAGQGLNLKENNVKLFLKDYIPVTKIDYQLHHHSHAAAGYYTSAFREACVVVIDAIGEFDTFTIWKGEGDSLTKIYSLEYPHSIGLWYSAMTQRIGLKPNEEEYILMGMAAFGDPDRLTNRIIDDFVCFKDGIHFKQNLHSGCKDWAPELTSEQDFADIAAATQKIYELIFNRILQMARSLVPSNNLVLMGGCALNCVANSQSYRYFNNVWIMPAPGDDGNAIGAVLAYKKKHIEWRGPYLGFDMGSNHSNEEIVNYLLKNKICGLARGRAEFGPRALGNRSLIADPRGSEIKDCVNNIKQRELFRPFAPAILEEFADQYFKMPTKSTTYMQFITPCLESESFPAVVHFDGTSRVQTVNKTDNPKFRELLELWYAKTGCPMLLNTSLNIKGQPMVNDHADAKAWSTAYGLPVFN